jgi:hypothetical protein
MSKSNTTETAILAKIFKATALPWDAEVNLTIHLHTEIPDDSYISTTNECAYEGYTDHQPNVARSAVGWDVTGNTAKNNADIVFPQCTGGSETIKGVSITPVGSTTILYHGELNDYLAVANLIQPKFAAEALTITED